MECRSNLIRKRKLEPDSIARFLSDHFVLLRAPSPPALIIRNWFHGLIITVFTVLSIEEPKVSKASRLTLCDTRRCAPVHTARKANPQIRAPSQTWECDGIAFSLRERLEIHPTSEMTTLNPILVDIVNSSPRFSKRRSVANALSAAELR
jgi:hypothetical protein